eukprot:scaffold14530_cov69-Phaeocystis_antarctica.AAC.7
MALAGVSTRSLSLRSLSHAHEVLSVVMSHLEWRPAPGTYQRFPGAQQPKCTAGAIRLRSQYGEGRCWRVDQHIGHDFDI